MKQLQSMSLTTLFISLFFQGSVPVSRGIDLSDHVTAVKPDGSHVSYSNTSAATDDKTSSDEFEHIIHSMAQV